MDALEHLMGPVGGPRELVAIDLAPGPRWLELVSALWDAGAAILPLDHRLSPAEKRAVLDRARPSALIDEGEDATLFIGDRVDEGIGLVLATSGTGGAPKLAELSRAAVTAALEASAAVLGATPADPWVACLSPAHAGGMLVLLRGIVLGAPIEVHERFDPGRLGVAAEGSFVSLAPSMLGRLLEERFDLARFGLLLVGGDRLDEAVAEEARRRGGRVVTTYGLTETCGGVVYDGRCLSGTRARIAVPEDRIELRGPTLMEGYRHDPAATAAAFTSDGWLRTGDAGALEGDGTLTVHGRLTDVIRTGGEKVWPDEVERALRDHPKVADVAVTGSPDPEWGQHVTAHVVPATPDDPPQLKELRDHTAERIARFKAPRELHLVEFIPRTPSGKIRRGELSVVTIEDVRALASTLPRSYEVLVRDRVKFRVGRIVYLAFSRDETQMGFAFPKEEREALVAAEPEKFIMPTGGDLRYQWVEARLSALDRAEMRELVLDAWRMVVPKSVAAAFDGK